MPESIQRDSWEPAGQSGQLLIYLFRCSVSLQVKVPVLVETVEIFTIGKKEGKKNAQKSNSKYQCEGSVLGLFFFCFFLFAWCSNVDVQNIDMGSVLWMSTMWIFLVPDMKVFSEFFFTQFHLQNFIYENNQSRFLKHKIAFTFWVSLCNFPWLDRKHSHQRPVERLFLASFPACSR